MKKLFLLTLLCPLLLGVALTNNTASVVNNDLVETLNDVEVYTAAELGVESKVVGPRSAVVGDATLDYSGTYYQLGKNPTNGNFIIRFATAVKGDLESLSYDLTYNGQTEVVNIEKVYKGISDNGTTKYYGPNGLTTNVDEATHYFACFTLEFRSDAMANTNFEAKLNIKEKNGQVLSVKPQSTTLESLKQNNGIEIKVKTSSTKIVVEKVLGAEYSLDGSNFTDNNVFSSLTPGRTYTVSLRMKQTETSAASYVMSKNVTLPLKDKMDIVIIAGQSNALGISYMNEIGLNKSYDDVQIYCAGEDGNNLSNYNKWTTVKTGLGINPDAFGPEVGISEILSPAYDDEEEYRNLAIVKYTWGGTAMWDWWLSPTSVSAGLGSTANINYQIDGRNVAWLYHNMVNTVRSSLNYFSNYDCSLIGMAWMQGESDASNQIMTNYYETILTNFINDVRVDLYTPNLPIYIGEINTRIAGYDNEIRSIQKRVCNNLNNVEFVNTGDLEMGYLDWWHFTAEGQYELGKRFGSKLLENTGLRLESVNDLDVNAYLNGNLREQLFASVNLENGVKGVLPVTITDAYALDSLGNKVVNGQVEYNGEYHDVKINVNVTNGALVDGVLDDEIYKNATKHEVPMYLDIYANPLMNPQIACHGEFTIVANDEGIYVGAELFDKQINNNFVNTASFDWDLCLNNGLEIFLDGSGTNVNSLTNQSAAIWVTSSDMLRYYDSNGNGVYDGINDYLDPYHKARQIVRETQINGTPNQNHDVDISSTFEVFIPYDVLGQRDISKYRVAIGFRTLHWFDGGAFELPYGSYCNGAPSVFNNGHISTWKPLSEVI